VSAVAVIVLVAVAVLLAAMLVAATRRSAAAARAGLEGVDDDVHRSHAEASRSAGERP
jgi:FlaG/FlaF family flagellin (archaellin)